MIQRRWQKKWSALTGLALEQIDGAQALSFANAALRFVKAADGRGDGLGGLDVTCGAPDKVLAAAQKRGLEVAGNQIMLCGTRFNLV